MPRNSRCRELQSSAVKYRERCGVCELSGVKFSFGEEGKHWNSPSIDRIDSARGYTIDNVRVVCWAINIALNKWGDIGLKKLLAEWLRNGSMLRFKDIAPVDLTGGQEPADYLRGID